MMTAFAHMLPSMRSSALTKRPNTPAAACLPTKEEIGSVGATGMHGKYFENAVAELVNATGDYSDLLVRRALTACRMLSCDVSAGYDPNLRAYLNARIRHTSAGAFASIGTPVPAARAVPTTPTPNTWASSAG